MRFPGRSLFSVVAPGVGTGTPFSPIPEIPGAPDPGKLRRKIRKTPLVSTLERPPGSSRLTSKLRQQGVRDTDTVLG